jgi:alkylated DNA repair dioxygenase AlkB
MNESFSTGLLAGGERVDLTLPPQGRLRYLPDWLERSEASRVFSCLERGLDWRQRPIRMFGREVLQPRLVCFYGEPGVRYRYSGVTLEAQPWDGELQTLSCRLSAAVGESFNSVLCNLYRDGRDSMGWHADNEPELGRDPVIASLSFGETRRFRLKPRGGGASRHLDLEHGSLLIMSGDLQHHWLHELPKSRRATGPRINLTFRRIA